MEKSSPICILSLFLSFLSCKTEAQNNYNGKLFLGTYWSTKPDSIKRERNECSLYSTGYGEKFGSTNISGKSSSPVKPLNVVFFFTEEYSFGDPDRIFITVPLAFSSGYDNLGGNYLNPTQFYTGGLTIGRRLFSRSSNPFFKTFALSIGAIYNYGIGNATVQNGPVFNNFYMDDFQARVQFMFEYPKGYYTVSKARPSAMVLNLLAFRIGYDLPLGPQHWYNPDAFTPGLPPSVNMGGFYVSIQLNGWLYLNKEMQKEEKKKYWPHF
jgi:hypothetical protein